MDLQRIKRDFGVLLTPLKIEKKLKEIEEIEEKGTDEILKVLIDQIEKCMNDSYNFALRAEYISNFGPRVVFLKRIFSKGSEVK